MPPLVDRPILMDHPPLLPPPPPPPTMTIMSYSFDADFTPIPYSPDSFAIDVASEHQQLLMPAQRFELISEEDAPRISAAPKSSHAKKRDAGHIPRPPNAFILFRSSFIKSESVPGNIEGNHSTLSKIIGNVSHLPSRRPSLVVLTRLGLSPTGKVWKTLPQAERELWENRAVQAQAEHRARYPDWRFRPGTNVDAIAKRKTKDKNKDRPPERRRRNASTRDKALAAAARGASGGAGGGGVGSGSVGGAGARCKKARGVMQERRCAQIAELLARGVKGVALTSAVQAWDKESGVNNVTDGVFVTEQGVVGGSDSGMDVDSDPVATSNGNKSGRGRKTTSKATMKARSASSAQKPRFTSSDVPLTAMYRRATSAPIAPEHGTGASPSTTAVSPVPDFCPPPLSPASSVSYGSEVSFPDSDNLSVSAFALRPPLRPSHRF